MNDPQFIEASRVMARTAIVTAGDVNARIDYLAGHLISRSFEQRERAVVQREYQDYLRYYDAHPDEARKLLAVGQAKADPALNPAEFAAMTMVASQLMNLDEVLNK